eukprot:NODE_25315_length_591_cov_6.793103.p1 GENE.NODE_25315_length_591_cov_6.793103~~NODE_25315_length_591_cov_6.793103.p1  ORF type:complete len:159 (-),score=11.75 NODE_25315_length_591_cov_6.793103:114-554(-)
MVPEWFTRKPSLDRPGWETRQNPVYPSPWNRWFPHEPVPSTPKVGPYTEVCFEGDVYHFCTCGESNDQPWCESGEVCSVCPEFAPRTFIPRYTNSYRLCGCKKAPTEYCNGQCALLWIDINPALACVLGFSSFFAVGLASSWFYHP